MNCFRTCIFVILKTTKRENCQPSIRLWIAFELVSSSYWKQHTVKADAVATVVNCFRTCIFVILKTTKKPGELIVTPLWIAFELVSSSYWKQQAVTLTQRSPCCELLSNLYLRHIENNTIAIVPSFFVVVNCFRTCIFVILKTTLTLKKLTRIKLWIAFELVSSSYWKQHRNKGGKSYRVVNCFRTCIFVILKTTSGEQWTFFVKLWIAFELVSSSYWKQLFV